MPATTSEAIANKARLRKERDRKKSDAKRLQIKKSDLSSYKIMARRMRPRLPADISKADLREMLAVAAANTVADNG